MVPKVKISVKTLTELGLRAAAIALNDLVFKDFTPDIIIGIRTGGYIVAEMMAQEAAHKPALLAISRQRSSTQAKGKVRGLKTILRLLPYAISDRLRVIEHNRLTSGPVDSSPAFTPDAGEMSELLKILRAGQGYKILVVDDAVDSGATMKAVLDVVRAEADSSCIIRSAAITVTTSSPLIKPDYTLYNHVLCRFPWSFDFKS